MRQTLKKMKGGLCCKYDYGNFCGTKKRKTLKNKPFYSDYFSYGYFTPFYISNADYSQ